MADENKNIASDDEYQFPQEEYAGMSEDQAASGSHFETASEPSPQKKRGGAAVAGKVFSSPVFRNKRVVGVIVVVVVLGIGLHFMNTGPKTVSKPKSKSTVVAQQQTPSQPVVQQQQTEQPAVSQAVYGELGSLREHTTRTQTDIGQLKAQVADLQNAVTAATDENAVLKASVSKLVGEVDDLKSMLDKTLSQLNKRHHVKRITYHIRAVIPDRAWLTSNKGKTTSITVGDHLKQYGFVKRIDSNNGIIYTSSGRKIVYGPNDF